MNQDHLLTAVLITLGVALLVAVQSFRGRKEKKASRPLVATLYSVGLVLASLAVIALLLAIGPFGGGAE